MFGYPGGFPDWNHEALQPDPEEISGAWNEREFVIVVNNSYQDFLRQLYDSFRKKDVAVWVGGGNVFGGQALAITIASLIPAQQAQQLGNIIRNNAKLELATRKSKIRDVLKQAGKGYYALSPAWRDQVEGGGLMFFLNPMNQKKYDHGWFSIEELQAWCRDEGPIVKVA